jgi:hypothetical protein
LSPKRDSLDILQDFLRGKKMADAIALPQVRPAQPALQLFRVIPGVLLLAGVGYAGKLLEKNVGAYASPPTNSGSDRESFCSVRDFFSVTS